MVSKNTAQDQIVNFISSTFLLGNNDVDLANCESFLESGIVDSTGILELVGFLQSTFAIKVEDHEMLPENLDSIRNMLNYLAIKGTIQN